MAEKIRKKVYKPVTGAELRPETVEAPEIREEPATAVQASAESAAVSETAAAPYAEFGGLSASMAKRRQSAGKRREDAMREWERRLAEQEHARLALVNTVKPENTAKEQRKLRNLAIGQAVGEFVGALFGGIHGLGSRAGRGYVPKMPGMYRNTLERLQQLKNHDIIANQRFRGLMGSMLERNAGDRAALARERWRDAAAEEKQLSTAQDYMDREAMRAGNRRELYEEQAEIRRELQQERHKQRLTEQRNAAVLKGGADDDVAYLTKLLLPKTRTSTTTGGKFPTRTVRDATSYSKQEVVAATALAKQIAPIIDRYDLSDKEVVYLNELTRKYSIKWDQIAALLEDVSVEDISAYLSDNGME
jgi:hypothetical protein